MFTDREIAEYYDVTLPYYKRFWHSDSESNALHYGFWEPGTKTLKEALINQNRFSADVAEIKKGEKVLDAGCGVGGSSLWLAQNRGAYVVGITLSLKQLHKAEELTLKNGFQDKTEFYVRDFLKTEFPDNSFDIVWAMESVCYAETKRKFLEEAYRVLRPGGRVVVSDGFLLRDPQGDREEKGYAQFLEGWRLPNLSKPDDFKNDMEKVGFRSIRFWDKTEEVKPSSRIMYRRTYFSYPIVWLGFVLGIVPKIVLKNNKTGIVQGRFVNSGMAGYAVFCGEK